MDTRKVTLVATIIAIALLAVGIGYAYTATTVNSGNNASPEYITLIQGDTGAYKFSDDSKIYWNTTDYKIDDQAMTDFTLAAATVEIPGMTGSKAIAIGNQFTLKASVEGNTAASTQSVSIEANNVPAPFLDADDNIASTVVFVVTTTGSETQYLWVTDVNTLTGYSAAGAPLADPVENTLTLYKDTDNTYKDATIQAYYLSVTPKVTVAHDAGVFPIGPSDKPLENSSLSFTISTNTYNPGTRVAVTGLSLSTYEVPLKTLLSDVAMVTATIEPDGATDKGLTASGYDDSMINVAIDGTSIRIGTPSSGVVTAGSTSVVITTNEGGFTKIIDVFIGDHFVNLTLGANMTLTSGKLVQAVATGVDIEPIIITAAEGYYFPSDYGTYTTDNVTVQVIDEGNAIKISGNLTENDFIPPLAAPSEITPSP